MTASPLRPEKKPRPDAADRILRATARAIVHSGAVAVTMSEVAEEAAVSKGLIHYHFHDKETLLARLVEWITRSLLERERSALADSAPRQAVDDLWRWLEGELGRGHIRVLNELSEWRGELVMRSIRESARSRRVAAASTVEHLFQLLGLRLRVPSGLVAEVVVAFMDGLAVSSVVAPEANPRASFDVMWLALLGLAE
ncbi:MAG: TetR/AcrR family transcriptional regulator [Gemmatimonadaceae bacterium]|jgi:AcrR family transcriptional regulator|nr:TetR/AcrR family transcriptional regulator [Gemmatimonadaceae bacterium]